MALFSRSGRLPAPTPKRRRAYGGVGAGVDDSPAIGELEFKFRGLVAQRDNLDRQIEQMKIRLDTYKDALALVTGAPAPAQQSREGANLFKPTETGAAWRDSLEAMRATGTSFTTDMIFADVNARGVKMIRPAVRGRLAELVDKRKLKRIREGVFEFPRGETAV